MKNLEIGEMYLDTSDSSDYGGLVFIVVDKFTKDSSWIYYPQNPNKNMNSPKFAVHWENEKILECQRIKNKNNIGKLLL